MEFKGTKGKWEVTPYQNVYCGINRVCTIGDLVKITEETKANAKLIASAPEMFEMLKELLIEIDELTIPTSMNNTIFRTEQLLKKITE